MVRRSQVTFFAWSPLKKKSCLKGKWKPCLQGFTEVSDWLCWNTFISYTRAAISDFNCGLKLVTWTPVAAGWLPTSWTLKIFFGDTFIFSSLNISAEHCIIKMIPTISSSPELSSCKRRRSTLTFSDVTDLVFKVGPSTAPGHVLQVEALIWAQHDHLDGTGLEQSNLVFSSQLPAGDQISFTTPFTVAY